MPGNSADEVILGWRDNDTFLSYTWGPGPGPHNLRFTNLHVAYAQEVWEWPFSQAAISSGGDGRILVGIGGYAAADNPIYGEGLYVLDPPDYQPEQLFDIGPAYIKPLESGAFLAHISGTNYLIEGSGFTDIANWDPDLIFSAAGTPAGYSMSGLWISLGGENQVCFRRTGAACRLGCGGQFHPVQQ